MTQITRNLNTLKPLNEPKDIIPGLSAKATPGQNVNRAASIFSQNQQDTTKANDPQNLQQVIQLLLQLLQQQGQKPADTSQNSKAPETGEPDKVVYGSGSNARIPINGSYGRNAEDIARGERKEAATEKAESRLIPRHIDTYGVENEADVARMDAKRAATERRNAARENRAPIDFSNVPRTIHWGALK